jgi:hypothetical protein
MVGGDGFDSAASADLQSIATEVGNRQHELASISKTVWSEYFQGKRMASETGITELPASQAIEIIVLTNI